MLVLRSIPKQTWIGLALVLGLFGVWLVSMAGWLWQRDHYQFFPLVLLAVGGLSWHRLQDATWNEQIELTPKTLFLGGLALVLAGVAVFTGSSWIGTIGAIVFLWMVIWLVGGRGVADRLRGPVALLLLVVPIPLDLDLWLIVELQKVATAAASGMLDWVGVSHLTQGVAISTVKREFMVEEACSGIHSLFSCLTVMMIWSVCHYYGWIRVLLTFCHTVVWVIAANSLRVFLVVWSDARFDVSLDSGWRHELLGVLTYLLALAFALSMDQWLRFLVALPARLHSAARPRWFRWDGLTRAVNYPLVSESGSLLVSKIAVFGLFLPLSFAALFLQFIGPGSDTGPPSFVSSLDANAVTSALPESVDEFRFVDVRQVSRSANDALGSNSIIATYQGNGITAQFSIDGFYPAWHDLAGCYTAMNWNVNRAENIIDRGQNDAFATDTANRMDRDGQTLLELHRDGGERAISMFSCYDASGQFVTPLAASGSPLRRLLDRLRSGKFFTTDATQSFVAPVHQYQLFVSENRDLLPHEREMLERLFVSLRQACRTALKPEALSAQHDLPDERTHADASQIRDLVEASQKPKSCLRSRRATFFWEAV